MAGDDSECTNGDLKRGEGAVGNVEPQVGFPVVGIGAVAFEAFVGKDRTNVEIEADLFRVTGVVLVVQAGGKNQNGSCDQDRYGSNATDGSRFSLKVS
jgi:hypothetical protein